MRYQKPETGTGLLRPHKNDPLTSPLESPHNFTPAESEATGTKWEWHSERSEPDMLTTEAQDILQTVERRLRPAKAPFQGDAQALADWTALLAKYDKEQVAAAFAAHLDGGSGRWPNYYTFRELLKFTRRRNGDWNADCDTCAGAGWKPGSDVTVRTRRYSTAVPCHCPHGQNAERSTLYTEHAFGLCHVCNGHGYLPDGPDNATKCDKCNGAGVVRPT